MTDQMPGTPPPPLGQLVRAGDRISFLYLERCVIHRDSNAITAQDESGTTHIPAATLGALLIGPGCSVSHAAIMLLAQSGSTAVWVGERGVRYYAHGRSLADSTRLLEAQAAAVSQRDSRLRVARAMYAMRFPEEEGIAELTMRQLRGREGSRMRRLYRAHAENTGVPWTKRNYDVRDFEASDVINQTLSAAHSSLYGIVHAVIVALGCAPGLGFVHTGHARSFVYDIADLYKAELSIPVAFEVAASDPSDPAAQTRRLMRDRVFETQLLDRCVRDIQHLLLPDTSSSSSEPEPTDERVPMRLWDDVDGVVPGGVNYDDEVDF